MIALFGPLFVDVIFVLGYPWRLRLYQACLFQHDHYHKFLCVRSMAFLLGMNLVRLLFVGGGCSGVEATKKRGLHFPEYPPLCIGQPVTV